MALIALVDEDRQFFKSAVGLPEPWATRRETPLSHSICQYVVDSGRPLAIEDARRHPLVRDSRAVSDLGVAAYLGIPLPSPEGQPLGAYAVMDTRPRAWTEDEITLLEDLAASVTAEIASRAAAAESERQKDELVAAISHDLRSPLTVLLGRLHVLRRPLLRGERPDPERLLSDLAAIETSVAQIEAYLDRLEAARRLAGPDRASFGGDPPG